MKNRNKYLMSKEEILSWAKKGVGERLLITAGAGDIDALVQPLKEIIENN